MTWMTKHTGRVVGENYDSKCDHLEVGQKSAMCVCENDGLGAPAEYHFCAKCWEKEKEAEAMETDMCYDCRGTFTNANLVEWKPYDYIPQEDGDPIKICITCQDRPTHINRVDKNKAAYEAEFPDEDDEWDDFDDDDYEHDEWDDFDDDDS